MNKGGEGSRGWLVFGGLDDPQTLVDWLVQLFRNERPATTALHAQRQRHNRHFDVSCFRVLKCLPDVVAVNQFRFHSLPKAGRLECLARGESVRRVIGISDRDALDLRSRKVGNTFESQITFAWRPQRDPATSVDRLRVRE